MDRHIKFGLSTIVGVITLVRDTVDVILAFQLPKTKKTLSYKEFQTILESLRDFRVVLMLLEKICNSTKVALHPAVSIMTEHIKAIPQPVDLISSKQDVDELLERVLGCKITQKQYDELLWKSIVSKLQRTYHQYGRIFSNLTGFGYEEHSLTPYPIKPGGQLYEHVKGMMKHAREFSPCECCHSVEKVLDNVIGLTEKDAFGCMLLRLMYRQPTCTGVKELMHRTHDIDPYCFKCLNFTDQLYYCGKCECTFYCSKECQEKDWSFHKEMCKVIKKGDDKQWQEICHKLKC
jgi:hypothetical protein